jgi:hypothetical protein
MPMGIQVREPSSHALLLFSFSSSSLLFLSPLQVFSELVTRF